MTVCVSYFDNIYSSEAQPRTSSWRDLARSLSEVASTHLKKTSLPCMVVGHIPKGLSRRNDTIESIDALVLDIERPKAGYLSEKSNYIRRLEDALVALEPYDYVLHTTFSHTPDEPRLRVVMPLSKSIGPADYKSAMSGLNNLTGGVADRNAQKPAQALFLPFCPPERLSEASGHINEGKPYDFNAPLAQEIVELRSLLGEGIGRAPMDAEKRAACRSVLRGTPYAQEGNRDNMALAITWHLARSYTEETMPSFEAFEAVFRWSTSAMGSDAPCMDNLWSKFTRGLSAKTDLVEEEGTPETVLIDEPVEGDSFSPLCLYKNAYYVAKRGGGYSRALVRDELPLAIQTHLKGRVPLTYMNQSGETKSLPISKVITNNGHLLEDVVIDLTAQQAYLENNVLHEQALPWPVLEPRFDPEIDQWLGLLGGTRSDSLRDWLSIFHDLNRLLSCLIIMGEPGAGKTLLAMGLASRLGADSPSSQKSLTGHFQGELAKCPLVHIDEEIIDSSYNRSFLASIRSELSVTERMVNRKYAPPSMLKGAMRCIITANHLPFKQKDASTRQDLEAIAQRFYWVTATKEAAEFLANIPSATKNWWRKEGIARHIRHLEETRTVDYTQRFGVPGESERLADLINISVEWNAWVTEWICSGVLDGFKRLNTNSDTRYGAFIKNRKIYVRANVLIRSWTTYLPDMGVKPNTRPITDALKGVSAGLMKPGTLGVDLNNRYRFYEIRPSPLIAWLEETGTGSLEEFTDALDQETNFVSNIVNFKRGAGQ